MGWPDVAAGEELCHSYVDPFASVSARQAHTASFGFACGCPLCRQDLAFEQEGKGSEEVASRMLDYTEGSLGDLIKKAMTGGDKEEAIASLSSCINSIEMSLGDAGQPTARLIDDCAHSEMRDGRSKQKCCIIWPVFHRR